jgi:glutamyl-tRNA synthetase
MARLGIPAADTTLLARIVVAQRERTKTLREMAENSRYFFGDEVIYDLKAAAKHLTADAKALIVEFADAVAALHSWDAPSIHGALSAFVTQKSLPMGKVAQPLRVAVTGGTVSPPIDLTLELLGRERSLARIRRASATTYS